MLCLSGFELYSRWVPLMKSTGKAESVLAGPLDACLRLAQEDLTTFLSGTAEY